MSSDTFPNVYTSTLWVPYTALGKQGPGNIQFPNSSRVTDDCSGHLEEGQVAVVRNRSGNKDAWITRGGQGDSAGNDLYRK